MHPMVENYQAYLLRLKRPRSSGRWQAALQRVHTCEISHFAKEEEMVPYLLQALADSPYIVPSAVRVEVRSTNLGANGA